MPTPYKFECRVMTQEELEAKQFTTGGRCNAPECMKPAQYHTNYCLPGAAGTEANAQEYCEEHAQQWANDFGLPFPPFTA